MATINGTNFADTLTGTLGDDVINGLGGGDTIYASQGADVIDGGPGTDRLIVNTFDLSLFAAATGARTYTLTSSGISDSSGTLNTSFTSIQRVTLWTGDNGDFGDTIDASGFASVSGGFVLNLTAGNGDDTIIGSASNDFIDGRLGSNIVDAGGGEDHVVARSDNRLGLVQYVTSLGSTVITTENGLVTNQVTNAEFVRVGGSYANSSFADGLTTQVDASGYTPVAGVTLLFDDHNGDDIFIGSSGNDIFGNTFTFTIGNDTYTGNGGADVYDYTVAVNALNNDVITDFDGDDIIDFQFNDGIVAGQLRCEFWIGAAAFSGVVGQYRYETSGGQTFVQIDTDGDSVADRTLTISNGQFALGETAPGSNQLNIIGASGTSGDDFYVGTLGDDQYYALGGNDTVAATGGMDHNYGGDGFDQLRFVTANADRFVQPWDSRTITITDEWVGASDGTINTYHYDMESIFLRTTGTGDHGDTIDASALTSAGLVLRLGAGNDIVTSGAGDDDIALNLGINSADAGGGIDTVYIGFDNSSGATAYITSAGGTVYTTVDGVQVASVINAEFVHVEGLTPSGATTVIDASGYVAVPGVTLVLRDSNGSDVIIGSSGNDYLSNVNTHVLGSDTFTGNGGADVFDWTFASDNINGDIITDFDTDDTLDFRFNDGTTPFASPLLCNQFIGNAAFSGTAGEYRFEWSGGETRIQVDTDGDAIADQVMTISNGEFGLVETATGSNILMRANLIDDNDNDDFAVGTPENDYIYTLGGNDFIAATRGIDFVDGGAGFDQLRFIMSNTGRFNTPTESLTYTITGNHVSDSSGQLDTSFANVEQVFLRTDNNGNFGDTIDASASSASLVLRAGAGNDTIIGSAGDDDITTGLGINSVDAGDGEDLVVGQFDSTSGSTAYVTFDGSAVITTVDGVEVNRVSNAELVGVQGSNFNAAVTTVDGSGLTGFGGLLIFYDHNGTNISIGSAGSDLFANVHGGEAGDDVYTGNGGADIYDYTYAVGAMDRDLIVDFDSDDTIDLQFNNATQNGGGLLADQFIGSSDFTGIAGQYRYFASGGQTFVQVDTNGDAVADETLTIGNGQFALGETFAGSNILQMIGTSGTANAETLNGTLGDDSIYAQGGADLINATQGNDFVDGGAANDRLNIILANPGRFAAATESRSYTITTNSVTDSSGMLNTSMTSVERITFSAANNGDFGDTLDASGFTTTAGGTILTAFMGHGNDTVIGTAYNDIIDARLGINTVDAGAGFDEVRIAFDNSGGETLYVTQAGGTLTTTVGGLVTNTVFNAEIFSILSGDFNAAMTVVDGSGLVGFDGTLVFYDNNGTNISIGRDGSDIFANVHGGEAGNDTYTGNGGADIYDYTFAIGAMDGDHITDFDADDVIDISFNNATQNGGGLLADQFIGSNDFTGVAGQYRYFASGGQTFVQVDTNGDAVADETLTIGNGQFALGETFAGSNILQMIGASGTSANDTLTGTLGDDSIYAQQGNDIINGSQGNDYIDGGNGGGDRLFMNTGNAALFTAATGARTYTIGNGTITDSSGTLDTSFTAVERVAFSTVGNGDFDDIIDASGFVSAHGTALDIRLGNGDNLVTGSGSNDRIFTGYGSNIVDGGAGYDRGFAQVDTSSAATVYITSVGNTLVTTVNGVSNSFTNFEEMQVFGIGTAALTLDATGWTPIEGQALYLVGHNGTDIMIGSAGSDYFANVTGQVLGNDVYTGNGGADIYDYTFAADSMNGDTITDFDIDDVIDFRFNNLEPFGSPLLCNQFIGAAAFSGVAGEYRYQIDGTQTVVQLDSDGDMVADQVVTISNGAFMLAETEEGSNILTLAAVIDGLDGIVADGYIEGATLFIDTDGDMILDAGEAWTTTDANGNFTLNVNQAGTLVAVGGTNIDTGLANGMTLAAPSGSGIVNPLTTLIQAVVDQSGGATSGEDAAAQVADALGLAPTIDLLTLDLIANGGNADALEAQKAAAMIANLVAAAEGATGSGAATESVLIGALADLIADTGAGETVDLTDAATLTPLLTEALPGVADVAAIADETALQGETIAAATSVDAISDAQLDAQTVDYSLDNIRIGDAADNFLYGLGGNDTLYGLGGNDRLVGGDGLDHLWGGAGDDVFVAEATATEITTKLGTMSFDVIFDFVRGDDQIDLGSLDANLLVAGHQGFTWKGSNANKAAGDLSFKVYTSVQGAEKALGFDIDGVEGASPYSGPVTIVYGNVDGGAPDFALALIGVNGVTQSDFLFA